LVITTFKSNIIWFQGFHDLRVLALEGTTWFWTRELYKRKDTLRHTVLCNETDKEKFEDTIGVIKSLNRRQKDSTMAKWKGTKWQTTSCKTYTEF
jgi:hypothetical protein